MGRAGNRGAATLVAACALAGVLACCVALGSAVAHPVVGAGAAQRTAARLPSPGFVDKPYSMGRLHLQSVWVDPRHGSDHHSGRTRAAALRTLTEAWNRIPRHRTLRRGYLIKITPGTLGVAQVPNYLESRYGTRTAPILIEPAGAAGSVSVAALNIFDTRYMYLVGLRISSAVGDSVHCERCDHFLLRDSWLHGATPASGAVEEVVKFNQSRWVWVEGNDVSGATNNAVDLVAVEHASILTNRMHQAGDWCAYAKGGSAYVRVEGNDIYDCGVGGFTAGQGSGLQFMSAPWLGYEAYDVKVYDNVIHDVQGAALGVNGGFDVMMAYNTAYRVGSADHVIEVVAGHRSCDGQPGDPERVACGTYLARGAWGTTRVDDGENYVRIPNRHVYLYDNVVYNPPGYRSQYVQFDIDAPYTGAPQDGSNVPTPTLFDDDLRIEGNLIWNGPADMPLGVGTDDGSGNQLGCADSNPTCNEAQLRADNAINRAVPGLVDPAAGRFAPAPGGVLAHTPSRPIPSFAWSDVYPALVPPGLASNAVPLDRSGHPRTAASPPGAYT
jgi:hypothetical protein